MHKYVASLIYAKARIHNRKQQQELKTRLLCLLAYCVAATSDQQPVTSVEVSTTKTTTTTTSTTRGGDLYLILAI